MIALAEEDVVRAKARLHEACVLDQDAVQSNNLIQREPAAARLHHCPAPTLQPVAVRALAFDFKARAAIGQQQETAGASDEMAAGAADSLAGLFGKREARKICKGLCPANNGTEGPYAEQIVAYAVAPGKARLGREVGFRVEDIDCCDVRRVRQASVLPVSHS